MSAVADQPSGRPEAYSRAFRLVHDIQTGVDGAAEALADLQDHAERSGWDEVVRATVFGAAVQRWFTRSGSTADAVEALINRSRQADDTVMTALGLALRSVPAFSGYGPDEAETADADLAQAIVLLDQPGGEPLARISAHTACGIALNDRWLFELGEDQYCQALSVGAGHPAATVDYLLAPIMFNIAEGHLSLASLLRQRGDAEGVAERWHAWRDSRPGTTAFGMADSWRLELETMDLLLEAIVGLDTEADCARLLQGLTPGEEGARRRAGLLRLGLALVAVHRGEDRAGEAIEAALELVGPDVFPHLHDLALCLAVEVDAAAGSVAGLRYARRMADHQWARRQAQLGAMRSRILSERLAAERDELSRHARLDELTGIGNRRVFHEYLAGIQSLDGDRIALILLDVDRFKGVNDGHGHLAGDAVLRRIARTLEQHIRPTDLAVRLGGDEFAVVLAGADLDVAVERTTELLREFDGESFDDVSPGLKVAVSAGIASGPPASLPDLLAGADAALYRAKADEGRPAGRSRLAVTAIDADPPAGLR